MNKFDADAIREHECGKWHGILSSLGIRVSTNPKKHGPCPTPKSIPVDRVARAFQFELAALAALDQHNRCSRVRKLIAETARRAEAEVVAQ